MFGIELSLANLGTVFLLVGFALLVVLFVRGLSYAIEEITPKNHR